MDMTSAAAPTWEDFVKYNLLNAGVVSGVCLISQQALPVYAYGELESLNKSDLQQFLHLFRTTSSSHVNEMMQQGFHIPRRGGMPMEFKIYQKTYCSIYATSPGNSEGLIISNLPHGVLVCTYKHPVQPGIAVKHVEQFCDKLRA